MFIERYTKELFCIALTNGLLYMITIKIIDERLTGIGTTELAEKYHMPAKYIRQLVQQYRLQGCSALKSNAHVKRNFTFSASTSASTNTSTSASTSASTSGSMSTSTSTSSSGLITTSSSLNEQSNRASQSLMNSTMLAINNRPAEGIRGTAKKLATGSVNVGEVAQPATIPTKLPSIGHASVKVPSLIGSIVILLAGLFGRKKK